MPNEVVGFKINGTTYEYDHEHLANLPTIDATPTTGSTNAVQSGGVKTAIEAVRAEIPAVDPTISQSGQAADALKTRQEIDKKVSKPLTSPNGTSGQLLQSLGDGTTQWTTYGMPTDAQVTEIFDAWLDEHPEATTTVQDGAITEAKLNTRLKLLTNVDLNGVTYFENIVLPVVQSYAEAVTYLSGYYYAVCREYSVTPNTCFVAKYDTSYNLIDTVYTSPTYGIANNIFNDGERIYIDYDSGYHVSFNTSISDDFAVQNTAIRNFAYWNSTLYGIAINANEVIVYTVASDFVTAEEVFSVPTQRYTLQSASIINGILYIPTTKGVFKFIDMNAQTIIAEVPYYDSKEIENFFLDKDGTVKCSGHFYGLNGIFNIGTFDGGVNGAKMQYTAIDGSSGDYRILIGERYGFYKISNGTAMGLPSDTGDLLLFNDAKFFVSNTKNAIYTYIDSAWKFVSFLSEKVLYKKVDSSYIFFELTKDGHFVVRSDLFNLTSSTIAINIDLSDIYTALGLADAKTFTRYVLGTSKTMNIAYSTNEVYGAQIYVSKTRTQIFTRNITQNTTQNIDARIEFYVTLM